MVLTFLSVCQKAPPGSVRPAYGTAAETPQKKTADSPAPPTHTEIILERYKTQKQHHACQCIYVTRL